MENSNTASSSIALIDPWLATYEDALNHRCSRAEHQERRIVSPGSSLGDFAQGHTYFGLHLNDNQWIFRERAPHASKVALIGDFSDWKVKEPFMLTRLDHGEWEVRLPEEALRH